MEEKELSSTYELTVLLPQDLSDFDVQKVIDKVKTAITSRGGNIQKEHTWGKKRLAYHINKVEFAHYQTLIFQVLKEAILDITKDIQLMPEIIRHLLISLEKEGVAVDQLFTPEKEAVLIATLAKEKMEPSKPHQTRATRGRTTPKVETAAAPEILAQVPAVAKASVFAGATPDTMAGKQDDEKTEEVADIAEPIDITQGSPDAEIGVLDKDAEERRREELDKKLDELLKE